MQHLIALCALAALVGCGADGEPVKPSMIPGIDVSTGTAVKVWKEPRFVGWGLGL